MCNLICSSSKRSKQVTDNQTTQNQEVIMTIRPVTYDANERTNCMHMTMTSNVKYSYLKELKFVEVSKERTRPFQDNYLVICNACQRK